MKKVIVITGASSGFGRLSANALAKAGHIVYASMRDTAGRNAPQVEAAAKFAKENKVDLRTIELDVASQASADAAIQRIVRDNGHLDVVIHNAGHMVYGPAEAFHARTTRRALRRQRAQHSAGEPRCAASVTKAEARSGGMGIQQQRSRRNTTLSCAILRGEGGHGTRWRYSMRANWRCGASKLRSSFPAHFTGGTNHFAHSGTPADKERVAEYEAVHTKAMERKSRKLLPPLFRPTRMRARWRTQSLKS